MVQLAGLIHDIMPWLFRRPPGRSAKRKHPLPREADTAWREVVEEDTFGANTPDYTHVEDRDDDPRRQAG